jgi:hypothetical protein
MADRVTFVGVRHHSPACARLVREVLIRERPRWVLVEGPSDLNGRLDELLLPHRAPLAVFSFCQDTGTGAARGLWTPFCDHSPEWVALRSARELGATPLFMDLPAWHPCFALEENRYSDRHARASDHLGELCERLGFEGTDVLWDHLFEGPEPELERRLAAYFRALRADEAPAPGDAAREDFMARFVAWAAAQGGGVVAVCGGYHTEALQRLWPTAAPGPEAPAAAPPVALRTGSYLVPYSFKRLDSFDGYASGMPSPAWYQRVWAEGPADAPEAALAAAIRHLRARRLRVSAADAIAARTLALGLAALRGRDHLRRVDVLDGLAGALFKDALETPLPWTRRGPLPPRTEPMLVELLAFFSGDTVGALAPGTPRPPLADDAHAELARVGLALGTLGAPGHRVRVDLTRPEGVAQSHVLHRLRILDIPGVTCERGPSRARQANDLSEHWALRHVLETESALIEAALWGAMLETAAAARLEARTRDAAGIADLAAALVDAVRAGISALSSPWLRELRERIAVEPSFAALGDALARLHSLRRDAPPGDATADLAGVFVACFDRGLWLFERLTGPTAPLEPGEVAAVRALRDVALAPALLEEAEYTRGRAVCRRRALDPVAPPALRGAALGFLWSLHAASGPATEDDDAPLAVAALPSATNPQAIGDFLGGLFALARAELLARDRSLLAAIDDLVASLPRHDFLVALPALRQAFEYFPPRERLTIAERLVGDRGDAMALLAAHAGVDVVRRGAELEARASALAVRFGLEAP